jgi:hypothetical protein
LLARLIEIIKDETIPGVRLGTSQLTEGFFQKYGFKTQSVIPNGIADGLDEVEMHLNFTPEARAQICEHWNIISSVE